MSLDSIKYSLTSNFGGYSKLDFAFDFTCSGFEQFIGATGSASDWTGYMDNMSPSSSALDSPCIALSATGNSLASATGQLMSFIDGEGLLLSETNIKIPLTNIDLSQNSFIFDFEFNGGVSSGILFGAFEKEELQLPDLSLITGSKGYNVGITDRGHLFLHGFSQNGDFVEVFNDVELSKRNCISVSNSNGKFSLGFFDFFNDKPVVFKKDLGSFYCSSPEYLYVGGTKRLIQEESPENTSFNGYLRSIHAFDLFIDENNLYNLKTGFLSEYQFESGEETFVEQPFLSGQITTYRTGITGYDCIPLTGQEATSLHLYSGDFVITGSTSVTEGDEYFALEGSSLIRKKYINNLNSGDYTPTGEGAVDTLGLNNFSGDVSGYQFNSYDLVTSGDYEYYLCIPLTGQLNEISGVQNIYGVTGYTVTGLSSSGLNFNLESEDFQMNYIYYEGGRE